MFIASLFYRIFGRKSKKTEIARNEKKSLKFSESCENFQSLDTSSFSKDKAYQLDLKLIKMRYQRNCKNLNPRQASIKSIEKSQHSFRSKAAAKSLSATETRGILHFQPSVPKINRAVLSPKKIDRIPTNLYVFRRTPVISRRKFPKEKLTL